MLWVCDVLYSLYFLFLFLKSICLLFLIFNRMLTFNLNKRFSSIEIKRWKYHGSINWIYHTSHNAYNFPADFSLNDSNIHLFTFQFLVQIDCGRLFLLLLLLLQHLSFILSLSLSLSRFLFLKTERERKRERMGNPSYGWNLKPLKRANQFV